VPPRQGHRHPGHHPDRPETGYGYIRAPANRQRRSGRPVRREARLATAERYLAEGGYFWNAGMFVLRPRVDGGAGSVPTRHRWPPLKRAWAARKHRRRFVRPGKAEFAPCRPSRSTTR
jgi:mannose-1-phosphate guanylyltransferase/mannose-6-phosphate isomerase